jgi:hypothetical protein
MNALKDNTTPSPTTTWWRWGTPARSGMRRLIAPWEYRHLRAFARVRFASGFFAAGFGLSPLLLSYGWTSLAQQRTACYWLAGLLLVVAAANFSFGFWEMTIARSASPRT